MDGCPRIALLAAHAVTGGVLSYVGGGKFGHGFFSAGVTKGLGTPFSYYFDQGAVTGIISQMVIGGTASMISGGKFANGAKTAFYQALYNHFRGDPDFQQIFKNVGKLWDEYWSDTYTAETKLAGQAVIKGCGANAKNCVDVAKTVQKHAAMVEMAATGFSKYKPAKLIAGGAKLVGDIAFVVEMGLAPDIEGFVPKLMGSMIDNRIYLRDGMTGKILQEQHHLAPLPGQLADFGMGLLLDYKPGAK